MNATAFDPALAGTHARLVGDDGRVLPVAVERWRAPANGDDHWLLDRCAGPTVDLGCGPGRLVAELAGLAGLDAGDRHRADRCFLELRRRASWHRNAGRHVSGW